jgi:hypothetical protein
MFVCMATVMGDVTVAVLPDHHLQGCVMAFVLSILESSIVGKTVL